MTIAKLEKRRKILSTKQQMLQLLPKFEVTTEIWIWKIIYPYECSMEKNHIDNAKILRNKQFDHVLKYIEYFRNFEMVQFSNTLQSFNLIQVQSPSIQQVFRTRLKFTFSTFLRFNHTCGICATPKNYINVLLIAYLFQAFS